MTCSRVKKNEKEEKVTSDETGVVGGSALPSLEGHARDCGLFPKSNGKSRKVLSNKQCDCTWVFTIFLSAI